jgi:hypothetical protein
LAISISLPTWLLTGPSWTMRARAFAENRGSLRQQWSSSIGGAGYLDPIRITVADNFLRVVLFEDVGCKLCFSPSSAAMRAEKTSTRLRRCARAKNQAAGKRGHRHQSGNHLFVSSLNPFDRTVGITLAHPTHGMIVPNLTAAGRRPTASVGDALATASKKTARLGPSNAKFKHGQK